MNVVSYAAMSGVACCVFASDATPSSGAFETEVHGLPVGAVNVRCAQDGGWSFDVKGTLTEEGVAEVAITLARADEAVPPPFSVSFDIPQKDAHHKWTGRQEKVTMPSNWGCRSDSRLCSWLPLVSFVNDTLIVAVVVDFMVGAGGVMV